jgi:ribonuclease R
MRRAGPAPPLNRRTGGAGLDALLSEVVVIERSGSDHDGVPLARVIGRSRLMAETVRIVEAGATGELPVGGRALARLTKRETGEIEACPIRRLADPGRRIVGLLQSARQGHVLTPVDRRDRTDYRVAARDLADAAAGDLVVAEPVSVGRLAAPGVRIVTRLGRAADPGAISLVALAEAEIPTEFPPAVLAEAAAARSPSSEDRSDLRRLPFVTIDDSEARDFDDAVWAEADPDPANHGGWHLVVAIADVAAHVPAGGAVDREAERRGNSVYFPDRVVPMLPERLSNELCSLQPNRDRACLAVHLWVDAAGRKTRHRFERAIIRSAARLTYERVQATRDGGVDSDGIWRDIVPPLYAAFAVLAQARAARGALELDLVEDRIRFDAAQRPTAVVPAIRLDSHRLVEEFMILANVAAGEELAARRRRFLYRVHDAPDPERLAVLGEMLDRIGIPGLGPIRGQAPKPALFTRLVRRATATPEADLVNDLVLRCQAQAVYSPDNIGHYGLALRAYAHFTSPIRRYADLVVHRVLAAGLTGDPPPPIADRDRLAALGMHLSATERRAAAAERAAADRYRALLMAPLIGRVFAARISGVAEYGLFVATSENRAGGLVPISMLSGDYYLFDRRAARLTGRSSGRSFGLGDPVSVRLVEADALSGRLVFRLQDEEPDDELGPRIGRVSGQRRPGRRRRG